MDWNGRVNDKPNIAVVIPCYKVRSSIMDVLKNISNDISKIYVVDDNCPDKTGAFVEEQCEDERVIVLFHKNNMGVGGAVITGYNQAINDCVDIIVKIDGDGQMNPQLIPRFVRPILENRADYTKGNRFFDLQSLSGMPVIRLFGNSILSFVNKLSSGYWNIMDPTNGYTAVHVNVLRHLPLDKIDNRYFFESDMLFRLGTIRAVVQDIPLSSCYAGEKSNLSVLKTSIDFPGKYLYKFFKRIFYTYFLRDFNIGSVELLFGLILFISGGVYGLVHWYKSYITSVSTATGIIMMAAFQLLVGFQLLLSAINYDIKNTPITPIHEYL